MADEIKHWLERHGLDTYVEIFAANDIDLRALPHLTETDLRELGLSMGHRKILLAAAAEKTPHRHLHADGSHTAERRQLTVMFCDLVGSTSLSQALDPEDLREVFRRYQDRVAGAITRYGGHVAKYLGDGVLAYFGWPRAHEDQSERAVRAGLDATAAVRQIEADGRPLQARVGIASGEVVIGDLAGEADAITGETPNLAARLQEAAKPNQVLLCDTTKKQVEGAFECEDLGTIALRGFANEMRIARALGERRVESRFEASRGAALAPLVGRRQELELLMDKWRAAKAGNGQAVFISGEAGIGKSRLTQALRQELLGEQVQVLTYQCSPLQRNTPFHPIVRRLEYALDEAEKRHACSRLELLEKLLRATDSQVDELIPYLADLLSIPFEGSYERPRMTPVQWKAKTIAALAQQLCDLSHKIPVVIIFEDAHWADPSSRELMAGVEFVLDNPILIITTHRPNVDFTHDVDNPSVTTLNLGRIGVDEVAAMLRGMNERGNLNEATIQSIADRADGVPLFVEELARGIDHGESGQIPNSLQAALTARLDRLGQSREIVQTAAVIGREFASSLLPVLTGLPKEQVAAGLTALCEDGIIVAQSQDDRHDYRFKHALVQEAAYAGVLRERRQQLHDKLAAELLRTSGDEQAGSWKSSPVIWPRPRAARKRSINGERRHAWRRKNMPMPKRRSISRRRWRCWTLYRRPRTGIGDALG